MELRTEPASYSFIGFNCDGFDILIEGAGTDSFTVFLDKASEVTKVIYRARYPRDTLTNTVTGKSIIVRGEFNEFIERIPGTDEFHEEYRRVPLHGQRAPSRCHYPRCRADHLRRSRADDSPWQAGEHDLALEEAFQPTFCDVLA